RKDNSKKFSPTNHWAFRKFCRPVSAFFHHFAQHKGRYRRLTMRIHVGWVYSPTALACEFADQRPPTFTAPLRESTIPAPSTPSPFPAPLHRSIHFYK